MSPHTTRTPPQAPPASPTKGPGTFSLYPPGSLSLIARKTSTPVADLSTICVPYTSAPLYAAVLEYAALSAADGSEHCPLLVDAFEELRLSQIPTTDDEDDTSSDDDYGAGGSIQFVRGRRPRRLPVPRRKGRSRYLAHPAPKYKYALGHTAVVWPPPRHLTGEYLVAQREKANKQLKRNKQQEKNEEIRGDGDVERQSATDVKNDLDGAVDGEVQDGTEAPFQEPRTIYVLHYAVGDPRMDLKGLTTYREVSLVSADGTAVLQNFAEEIIKWRAEKDHREIEDDNHDIRKFSLYRFKTDVGGAGFWESEGLKRARPPSSVILPNGQVDDILNDVRNFIKTETRKWYIAHGLPQRRSYLFYGPPGTGKTSTIRVIASLFNLNCCFLSMMTAGFNNQVLGDAFSQMPPRALIVLEDVDALFNEGRQSEQGHSLTFSGLLNALDGLISADGVITIMTTNYINRLDQALVRGGRVDRLFAFDKPTDEQLQDLFRSFYPETSDKTARKFLEAIRARPEGEVAQSIATLQQLFIFQREKSDEECVAAVSMFFEQYFPVSQCKKDGQEGLYS